MIGWEFPPLMSGGLGVACEAIARNLAQKGVDVTFIMPTGNIKRKDIKIYAADSLVLKKIKMIGLPTLLSPYLTPQEYEKRYNQLGFKKSKIKNLYGPNIWEEIHLYAVRMGLIVQLLDFDIIHAHDWMTFPAAILAKKISGKPLILHVHATEFDRTGGNCNQRVYDIEKMGMEHADKIIAVSNYIKRTIVEKYGIPEDKVVVIHNGMEVDKGGKKWIKTMDKVVLFVGRITLQKGPEYFIRAAKKALEYDPNIKFVVVGGGDMESRMIEEAARLGISRNVIFTGFLSRDEVMKIYEMADIYVMPSVSEPFGLTALEAALHNTPVIISKQSGVSEVMKHALKVDFYDTDKIAHYIIALLNYRALSNMLKHHGRMEILNLTWDKQVEKMINLYESVLRENN